MHADRAETHLGANSATAEAGVSDQIQVWANSWVQGLFKQGHHTPKCRARLARCAEDERVALERVIKEVQPPSGSPLGHPLTMPVGRQHDLAAAAAQEARPEAADAQPAASREVGEHKPVEMDVE